VARYADLKKERDGAVERMLVAERNSKLEELNRQRAEYEERIARMELWYKHETESLRKEIDHLRFRFEAIKRWASDTLSGS
jgi:predicted ATPase